MNVLLVLHLTKTVVSACGLARLLTAVALSFLSMTREVNSNVHHLVLQAHSPSTPILQTAGNTSSASMESPENRAVPWEKCSMQEQDLVRMDSVQTQNSCQNAQTTTLVVMMQNSCQNAQ